MISISDLITILVSLGSVVGVWVDSKVRLARLDEKIISLETGRNYVDIALERMDGKIDKILAELNLKADRHDHSKS